MRALKSESLHSMVSLLWGSKVTQLSAGALYYGGSCQSGTYFWGPCWGISSGMV